MRRPAHASSVTGPPLGILATALGVLSTSTRSGACSSSLDVLADHGESLGGRDEGGRGLRVVGADHARDVVCVQGWPVRRRSAEVGWIREEEHDQCHDAGRARPRDADRRSPGPHSRPRLRAPRRELQGCGHRAEMASAAATRAAATCTEVAAARTGEGGGDRCRDERSTAFEAHEVGAEVLRRRVALVDVLRHRGEHDAVHRAREGSGTMRRRAATVPRARACTRPTPGCSR